jgi:hypothetical protein
MGGGAVLAKAAANGIGRLGFLMMVQLLRNPETRPLGICIILGIMLAMVLVPLAIGWRMIRRAMAERSGPRSDGKRRDGLP